MFTAGLWLMLVIPLFSQEGRIQEIQSLYEQSKKFGNYPDSLWQYGEKILSLSEENNSFGQLTGYYLKGYSEYKKGAERTGGECGGKGAEEEADWISG